MKRTGKLNSLNISYYLLYLIKYNFSQAYCNIITGASFCIGLRYAGTENPIAFNTLKTVIDLLLASNGKYLGEFAGKCTIESCLVMVLLSISMVSSLLFGILELVIIV